MPKVSIVVPCYNIQKYVGRCIESLLAQTFTDFELILVNDGSTDDTLSILKEYEKKDSRIIVLEKENGGLSDARNAGMKIAKGEYIQFVDGDDFAEDILLEKCAQKLDETGADIVIFDFYQYYTETNTKEVISHSFDETKEYSLDTTPTLLTNIKNAAWNKMYKLSLFKENHIEYPFGYYYEDLGTTYRLLPRAKKIVFINQPLLNYLQDRPGNITTQFNQRVYHIFDMIQLLIDDYKALGIYEKYYEELKYLGSINILECLKKTRMVKDSEMANKFVEESFSFLRKTWPEFPKCKYPIKREKNDWVYTNEGILKLYLAYRRRK